MPSWIRIRIQITDPDPMVRLNTDPIRIWIPDPDPGSGSTTLEFIDPVFVKTSPKRSFLVIENERFGLVFAKAGTINSGTDTDTKNFGPLQILSLP